MTITDLTPEEQELVLAHRAKERSRATSGENRASSDQPYTFWCRRAIARPRQMNIERISLVLCKYAAQFEAE